LAETESQARVIEQAESVAGEEHTALQRVEFDRRRRVLSDINESWAGTPATNYVVLLTPLLDRTCSSTFVSVASNPRKASVSAVSPSARRLVVAFSVVPATSRNLLPEQ
jgi:hypothetical protein